MAKSHCDTGCKVWRDSSVAKSHWDTGYLDPHLLLIICMHDLACYPVSSFLSLANRNTLSQKTEFPEIHIYSAASKHAFWKL